MPSFSCQTCRAEFAVSDEALQKYPGWTPKVCLRCKDRQTGKNRGKSKSSGSATRKSSSRGSQEQNLTLEEVLERYSGGPETGVFTDGASHPNPGPGGWGAVFVKEGTLISQSYGKTDATTNNRMELTALLEGCKLVPEGETATLWTDSQLCVNTINKWAVGWEKNGWKRKGGEIKNLELVRELYRTCQARPELELRWIKAHSGNKWNEYADSLATAYRRDKL